MSLLTIPNSFTNGTGPANIIDATQMNANFTAVATAVNNIYPSQILPITTGQATFGATATGVGYKFLANDATATPLTISGVTSQSVDILDVTLTSGGTKAFGIGSAGLATIGAMTLSTVGTFTNSTVAIANDGAGTNGLEFNVPTGSTNGFRFLTNGSAVAQITAAGAMSLNSSATALTIGAASNATTEGIKIFTASTFTDIGWNGAATINTIAATAFGVDTAGTTNLATMDTSGNFGILGTLHQTSRRAMKKDIAPLAFSALEVVCGTEWLGYRLIGDPDDKQPHTGFIAEDTHEALSGKDRDHQVPSNTAAITAASVKELTLKLRAAGIAV